MRIPRPKPKLPPPPRHLGPAGKKLWREIIVEFEVDSAGDRMVLLAACESLDRAKQAEAVVAEEGLTTTDRFGQSKPHPAVNIERDARKAMLAALKQLRLDEGPPRQPGRQPGVPYTLREVRR